MWHGPSICCRGMCWDDLNCSLIWAHFSFSSREEILVCFCSTSLYPSPAWSQVEDCTPFLPWKLWSQTSLLTGNSSKLGPDQIWSVSPYQLCVNRLQREVLLHIWCVYGHMMQYSGSRMVDLREGARGSWNVKSYSILSCFASSFPPMLLSALKQQWWPGIPGLTNRKLSFTGETDFSGEAKPRRISQKKRCL